jgi:hypothetical protein
LALSTLPQAPHIPDITLDAKPDFLIDSTKIPKGMLDHLLAEEMCCSGLGNMKDDLLCFLMVQLLTSGASQKLEAGLALSSVSNQLKWQQLGQTCGLNYLLKDPNLLYGWRPW